MISFFSPPWAFPEKKENIIALVFVFVIVIVIVFVVVLAMHAIRIKPWPYIGCQLSSGCITVMERHAGISPRIWEHTETWTLFLLSFFAAMW